MWLLFFRRAAVDWLRTDYWILFKESYSVYIFSSLLFFIFFFFFCFCFFLLSFHFLGSASSKDDDFEDLDGTSCCQFSSFSESGCAFRDIRLLRMMSRSFLRPCYCTLTSSLVTSSLLTTYVTFLRRLNQQVQRLHPLASACQIVKFHDSLRDLFVMYLLLTGYRCDTISSSKFIDEFGILISDCNRVSTLAVGNSLPALPTSVGDVLLVVFSSLFICSVALMDGVFFYCRSRRSTAFRFMSLSKQVVLQFRRFLHRGVQSGSRLSKSVLRQVIHHYLYSCCQSFLLSSKCLSDSLSKEHWNSISTAGWNLSIYHFKRPIVRNNEREVKKQAT